MYVRWFVSLLGILLGWMTPPNVHGATWGRDYFPNIELINHEGESVRFFDDLVEGRIVVINFIYTTCPDTCPLETAKLVHVQNILGDRVGRDVFFYSISIDPEQDTPEVLRAYRDRFRANWMFLTGNAEEIDLLRRKLGLYIPEIQDGSGNHNVSMIIGNQATGRWMKRSPFENPYVLADQIGNWLDGWKRPPAWKSYLDAPKLREVSDGEFTFRTRCASCHSLIGKNLPGALGPDLLGVTLRRPMQWLMNWIQAPDRMLADKDPMALALFEQYNRLPMPNLRLTEEDGVKVLDYIKRETQQLSSLAQRSEAHPPTDQNASYASSQAKQPEGIIVHNLWIREAHPASSINAGYFTLTNTSSTPWVLKGIASSDFETAELHEMANVDGLMRMRALPSLQIPEGGSVELRPGGYHLMLKGRKRPLRAGAMVDLILEFEGSHQLHTSAKVIAGP